MIETNDKVFLCREDLKMSSKRKDYNFITVYDFMSPDFNMQTINKAKVIMFSDGNNHKLLKKRF